MGLEERRTRSIGTTLVSRGDHQPLHLALISRRHVQPQSVFMSHNAMKDRDCISLPTFATILRRGGFCLACYTNSGALICVLLLSPLLAESVLTLARLSKTCRCNEHRSRSSRTLGAAHIQISFGGRHGCNPSRSLLISVHPERSSMTVCCGR